MSHVFSNFDGLARLPDLQRNVLLGILVYLQNNSVLHILAESRVFHRDLVVSDRHQTEQVIPIGTGGRGARNVSLGIGQRHLCVRDDGAGRILHRAVQLRRNVGSKNRKGEEYNSQN